MKRVIALGFFDGVHNGHAELLRLTKLRAEELQARSCALTFDAHPETVITGQPFLMLNSLTDRADLMRRLYGIEEVIFAHFDAPMMHTRWDNFLSRLLIGQFDACHVVCGYDFHFGFKGEGNPARLREECAALGIGCDILSCVRLDDITVSSTYIRRLIAQGDMERAARFYGHPHVISGYVARGSRLGASIGVPTINIAVPDEVLVPARGVYVTSVFAAGKLWPAISNVGVRPTVMSDGSLWVESSLFGFTDELYGENVRVEFHKYLREEKQFSSIEDLRTNIKSDIREAERYHKAMRDMAGAYETN